MKYGCGTSFVDSLLMDKEEVEMALKGKIRVGENEDGFIYEDGSKEDCDNVILCNFDRVAYQAVDNLACANAYDEIFNKDGDKVLNMKNICGFYIAIRDKYWDKYLGESPEEESQWAE